MATAFEAVDRNRVAADALGFQRMTNGGAFVDHLDAGAVQRREHLNRIVTSGFDDLDAAFDDCLDHAFIIGRVDHRQESQVHAERLVGHLAAFGDFIGQSRRRRLGQCGNDTEPASVGHSGGQFGKSHIMHAALNDRMFDAEKFRDACFHGMCSCSWTDWKHVCSIRESFNRAIN
jgi:hypothetical protein